jgi:hypothetical protein
MVLLGAFMAFSNDEYSVLLCGCYNYPPIRIFCQEMQEAEKKDRGVIFDRLVPTTGINRNYLAWALRKAEGENRPLSTN